MSMEKKIPTIAFLLATLLIVGNVVYPTMAQSEPTTFLLQFMAAPQKLIHNTDASLLVYAVDNKAEPLPIKIPTLSVTSSDPSVVRIKEISSSKLDNSVKVDIFAGKIGSATVTAAAGGFLSSTVTLEVVGDAYKPEGLLIKAIPSSFSHSSPYNGYVSIQLINFFGNPVSADEDIVINLSSSDLSVVNLNKQVVIKRGENYIINNFIVAGSGITLLQAEVPGKWEESTKITVPQPKTPLQIKFYVAPQIAPAMQGQVIYGFVQLQDTNGIPVKAEKEISVKIISDSADIRVSTGSIEKGSASSQIKLTVNTNTQCVDTGIDRLPNNSNFNPCIELTAIAKGFKSQSSFVELRSPVTRVDLNPDTRFDDPRSAKIDPVFFPTSIETESDQENIEPIINMPIFADGTEQVVGVVQLMRYSDTNEDGIIDLEGICPHTGVCPAIPFTDVPLIIESDDDFKMEIKTTVIPKGSTSTLVKARVGYEGGTAEIAAVAEYFGQTFTQLRLHGHSGIEMEAEPLISRIMAKSDFPYIPNLSQN